MCVGITVLGKGIVLGERECVGGKRNVLWKGTVLRERDCAGRKELCLEVKGVVLEERECVGGKGHAEVGGCSSASHRTCSRRTIAPSGFPTLKFHL